jgi:hydrogenase nickel incorporation protein HypA/HybF
VHELAIAQAVLEIGIKHARGRRVTQVDLSVGHLRQVVPSALTLAFELVAEDTVLEGARLAIKEVPAAGVCRECGAESALREFPFCCARCGGLEIEVTSGEELLVESLDLEEEPEDTARGPDASLAASASTTNGGING